MQHDLLTLVKAAVSDLTISLVHDARLFCMLRLYLELQSLSTTMRRSTRVRLNLQPVPDLQLLVDMPMTTRGSLTFSSHINKRDFLSCSGSRQLLLISSNHQLLIRNVTTDGVEAVMLLVDGRALQFQCALQITFFLLLF